MQKKIMFVFGTRPEAIKMAPAIRAFKECSDHNVFVCNTGQHKEMLNEALDFFQIVPDVNLDLMKPMQTLAGFSSLLLISLDKLIKEQNPGIVFVQGDTASAFMGALAAYYNKTKVAHIEAGLRSYDKYSPFPEETNRVLISHLSDLHFAPTEQARIFLTKEDISEKDIFVVGNTVIDALMWAIQKIKDETTLEAIDELLDVDFNKKVILVTGHRRESFGETFAGICEAILEISNEQDVEIVYPVHMNPKVQEPVFSILKGRKNIHLIKPLSYPKFVFLMSRAYFILTDSGGIQEEAISLKKPTLVMRNVTERTEGIECGGIKLIGTNKNNIVYEAKKILSDKEEYEKMIADKNPFGDGEASKKICEILEKVFSSRNGIRKEVR